ncbi:protein moonraker [Pelodytes ibericus]
MASDFQLPVYPRATQPGLHGISSLGSLQQRGIYKAKENQLQFNRAVPSQPANLAVRFSTPCPIVIEKLRAPQQKAASKEDALRNSNSSISFTVVSEERLNFAHQLAKRDVKRKHVVEKLKLQKIEDSSPRNTDLSSRGHHKVRAKTEILRGSKKAGNALKSEVTKSGALVYVYTPDRNRIYPAMTDSPPTRDPGPGTTTGDKTIMEPSEQEVRRLQKELHSYMLKIEELARREHSGEVLDPVEQARGLIRQHERAARSARMLYVLQQQVKEIQNDLDQLSPQKIKHTKRSHTMSRLATVHRGAIRALRLFVSQLSERGEQQIPTLYKDLAHVIRQLSLCTAKVKTGKDPADSNTIISILQQAEDLDVLLERKISSHARKASPNTAKIRSPSTEKQSHCDPPAGFPPPVLKQHVFSDEKLVGVRRRLLVENIPEPLTKATQTEPIRVEDPPNPKRRAAIRFGLKALIKADGLKGIPKTGVGHQKRKGVLLPHRPQVFRQPRRREPSQRAHFQKKTVAFALKENQPPVREKKTPWMPPNTTSSPSTTKRVNRDTEKRSTSDDPPRMSERVVPKIGPCEKETAVTKEAVRLAWLDAETSRRKQELDNLYREEVAHMHDLWKEIRKTSIKSDGDHPENNIEILHHVDLPKKQTVNALQEIDKSSSEQNLSSMISLQDDDLETMIQRMEEIEKYQEIVRQRCNRIVYADPEFWAQEEKDRQSTGMQQNPQSPHPIRITKQMNQREPVVDILLEEPSEGDSLQISKEELSRSSLLRLPQRPTVQTQGLVRISVPTRMLQSIKDYSKSFERRLQLTAHKEVGRFNPWHISESMAEELLEEALDEVSAELQVMCEGYADAVFTSEFLEPTPANH